VSETPCVFCRIVKGEIPCAKIYEDDEVLAFLDLAPVRPGHSLVIPKKHYDNLLDTPESFGPCLLSALAGVGAALMKAAGAQGFNVLQNNFPASGQAVFHAHWHVIPRVEGDGLSLWPQGAYADARAMRDMAAAIAAHVKR
jgi:histidine triad (HIT) family protein